MTHYIENEAGAVHSVSDEGFQRLHESENGREYLLRGLREITAAEAKKKHPQLFGTPDPQITYTDDELVRAARRKQLLAQINGETALDVLADSTL